MKFYNVYAMDWHEAKETNNSTSTKVLRRKLSEALLGVNKQNLLGKPLDFMW